MIIRRFIAAIFLVLAIPAIGQTRPYPASETDKISAGEFKARRDKVRLQMGAGTLGIFFTSFPSRETTPYWR